MADPIVFWIDSASNRLAAGWNQFIFAGKPTFKQGDALSVLLRWVKRPNTSNSFMEEVPWGNKDISFEVGNIGWKPMAGEWYLNYDDYSTELIDYKATASDLELALNTIVPIVEAGGVSVTQYASDGYKVIFREDGTRLPLSGYGEGLIPTSNVIVDTITLGSATTKAVFWITLRQTIVTEEVGNWENEDACEAAVESIKPDIWDIYLTSQPQDGEFSVSLNGGDPIVISVFATPSTIQDALGSGYSVSKQGDYRWRVKNDAETAFVLTVEEDTDIVSFHGKKNTILFDRQLISEMLSGSSLTSAMLEISVMESGNRQTLLSVPCTITSKTTP